MNYILLSTIFLEIWKKVQFTLTISENKNKKRRVKTISLLFSGKSLQKLIANIDLIKLPQINVKSQIICRSKSTLKIY